MCVLFFPPGHWAHGSHRICPGPGPLVVTSGMFLSSRGQHALPSTAHQLRLWRPTERGRGPHWEVFCCARCYSEGGCFVQAVAGWSWTEPALDSLCCVDNFQEPLGFKGQMKGGIRKTWPWVLVSSWWRLSLWTNYSTSLSICKTGPAAPGCAVRIKKNPCKASLSLPVSGSHYYDWY